MQFWCELGSCPPLLLKSKCVLPFVSPLLDKTEARLEVFVVGYMYCSLPSARFFFTADAAREAKWRVIAPMWPGGTNTEFLVAPYFQLFHNSL